MSRAYANERGIAVANLVHASGNVEDAAHEIDVWFAKDEIHDYAVACSDRYVPVALNRLASLCTFPRGDGLSPPGSAARRSGAACRPRREHACLHYVRSWQRQPPRLEPLPPWH